MFSTCPTVSGLSAAGSSFLVLDLDSADLAVIVFFLSGFAFSISLFSFSGIDFERLLVVASSSPLDTLALILLALWTA
jgi:hypothetical protein